MQVEGAVHEGKPCAAFGAGCLRRWLFHFPPTAKAGIDNGKRRNRMALDAALLELTARELKQRLADARIDKIFEPTHDEVVLHLRTRTENHRLLVSARSGSARVCITQETFENPAAPPSFCMLLRKHFSGGRLVDVRVIPGERIAFFDFACTNEMGDSVCNTLAAELMGRYSNIVLVQDGKILDALKRVDFEASAVRQLLPGLPYTLPPKPDRPLLMQAPPQTLASLCAQKDMPVADALMKATGGCGPAVCREVAFRAFGTEEVYAAAMTEAQRTALAARLEELQTVWRANGTPTAVVSVEGRPVEFSFVPLHQYGDTCSLVPYESCSALLEGYYAAKDKAERLRQRSKDLAKTVKNLYERAQRKLAARRAEQQESAQSGHLRVWGELLMANLWALHKGDRAAAVTNYYTGETENIPLDVRLSPTANAQKYFKEYKKKQTAAKVLRQLIEESQAEVAYLETVLYEVGQAEGEAALAEVREELRTGGYLKRSRQKEKKQKPADFIRYRSSEGFVILVGRNNMQNEKLTLKTARGRDVWFHVKNAPGSHVVVLCEGLEVPNRTKTEAAILAAYHSSQNGGAKVPVDYTFVKHIRKTGGLRPGMVLYDIYETAYVTPDAALAARLAEN
jgi:predicted ribosome quality control (RQC) complex YloA/Tae2 family protein